MHLVNQDCSPSLFAFYQCMRNKAAPVDRAGVLTHLNALIKGITVNHLCGCLAFKPCPMLWPLPLPVNCTPSAGPLCWIQANKLLDHPDGHSGWGGNRLKHGWFIVTPNYVCGETSEVILSPWEPSQAYGYRLIWSENRIPCIFLEVISQALIITLEGRRIKRL